MQELQMFLYKHCLVWYCYQNTKTVIEEEKIHTNILQTLKNHENMITKHIQKTRIFLHIQRYIIAHK